MADDEDPVVHEVDVYLSKSLSESLYVFQYPVRPAHLPYDDIDLLTARVKPKQQKVELELGVNSEGNNYCVSKGEQLALNVDGSEYTHEPQGRFFKSNVYDKQVLSSTPQAGDTSKYAIGLLKDGELHLTPVHGILQLKPTFSYLDKADAKHKNDQAALDPGENSQDEEEEVKAVTVKFARPESAEAKARRMASYDYIQGKRAEEAWVHVSYHLPHTDRSHAERLQLYANKTDEISEFQMTHHDYVSLLMPKPGEKLEEKPAMPNNVLSLAQLRTLPLSDQVRALLINAKTIRMSQLMSLLPNNTEVMSALRSLQQVAMLVQGCWVVKSDILYPKDSCSPHTGISAEVMCKARDYVMWKFTQYRCVMRKEVSSVVKLPAEDMKAILEHMSRMKASVGWEFLYQYDKEFTDRYPEIVQRQKMLWDAKYQTLSTQFKIPKDGEKKAKDVGALSPEKPKRRRRTSSKSRGRTLSGRSVSDQSDTDVEMTEKLGQTDCKERVVEVMEVTECTASESHPHMTVNGEINSGGDSPTKGHNSVVCGLPPPQLHRELVEFTRDKLHSKTVLLKTDLKRLFSLFLTQCPPEHVLRSGVSDQMLEESVLVSGGVKLEFQGIEPFYILKTKGDDSDKLRAIVVEMLQTSNRIRTVKLRQKVEETLGSPVGDAACKQMLKEYCETKNGNWYLKGTTDMTL
ncbi:DNA-directed RNA polymerase III subunit RPC5-like [Liolophura sinensis]|uniref:DNA-directed RNA polymerase III subunit RPC5-like n=1 Tax=Liolophura sinensis TaxID=3198878 RepID=UPI00315907B5